MEGCLTQWATLYCWLGSSEPDQGRESRRQAALRWYFFILKEGVLGLSGLSSTCLIGMFGIPQLTGLSRLGRTRGPSLLMDSASNTPRSVSPSLLTLKLPCPNFPLLWCHLCLDFFFQPCSILLSSHIHSVSFFVTWRQLLTGPRSWCEPLFSWKQHCY